MKLSRSSQYAIRAMTYLAQQEAGRLMPIREIAERVGIPLPFLNKILSRLSHHGMVTTRRGPRGGVMLACRPGELTIGDVVAVLDGPFGNGMCYLGLEECSDRYPCPVHDSWKSVREELDRTLHTKTFRDLSRVRGKGNRSKQRGASRGRGAER